MLAILCSGQGKQNRSMFDFFADAPEAEPLFAAATGVFGVDPRHFVIHAREEALQQNRASQLLNVTRALVAQHCVASAIPQSVLIAGYSVGEMAAWGIGGVWSVEDTLRLTARRAELMDQASGSDDTLGFVRGLDYGTLHAMTVRSDCAIAIINPGQLFIVGGERDKVDHVCRHALHIGATHSGLLPVQVASHTARLSAAVEPFEEALGSVEPQRIANQRKLIGAANAEAIFRPAGAIQGLASQLSHTIDWQAVVIALVEQGADRVLELGPGSALADMIQSAFPSIHVRALDHFRSLEGVRTWLAA